MSKVKIGRWIYCKYCHKMVKPELGGVYQVLCPECHYGLTPDFFSAKGLEVYIKTNDYDIANECEEEHVGLKTIMQALRSGEEILKDDGDTDCNHISQPYARAISELAIKKWKKQRTIIQNSLK